MLCSILINEKCAGGADVQKTKDQLAEYLFHQGTNYRAYTYLGAHRARGGGYVFRVWAPNADAVYLTGDFNGWGADMLMEKQPSGIWTATLPDDRFGEYSKYKFIVERGGKRCYKSDPYAFYSETGEKTASIRYTLDGYDWQDGAYMQKRHLGRFHLENDAMPPVPVNIYEVHLGSWKRKPDGSYLTYRELADELSVYAADMGYTHIELMPVAEHPYDGSWGYQVCGYYAPTSRFGEPKDFMYFVDRMHAAGIGVILDWVPAHFPKDAHGLYAFDGGPLYEYQGADRQEHREWGTRAFDVGRTEVQSFLVSNALFWFDKYHIDGLRIDAVASMLYLDYGRQPGEWNPNPDGSNINRESVAFFKKLNAAVSANYPDVLMIAEESTAYPLVTYREGLGFSMKWNMGWMNDTLAYIAADPIYRKGMHNKMTFSLMYAFGENYVLPISHDEVVHGKKSLLDKMYGSYEQKFATMRAYLSYMTAHPGKKLLFMGCEFGQFREWDYASSLEWFMLDYEMHAKLRDFVRTLNRFYLAAPPLWELDRSWEGFCWTAADRSDDNVLVFERYAADGDSVVFAVNFSGAMRRDYPVPVRKEGVYRELLNSDDRAFGGTGILHPGELPCEPAPEGGFCVRLDFPPLTALFLKRIDPPVRADRDKRSKKKKRDDGI